MASRAVVRLRTLMAMQGVSLSPPHSVAPGTHRGCASARAVELHVHRPQGPRYGYWTDWEDIGFPFPLPLRFLIARHAVLGKYLHKVPLVLTTSHGGDYDRQ